LLELWLRGRPPSPPRFNALAGRLVDLGPRRPGELPVRSLPPVWVASACESCVADEEFSWTQFGL
jgi:hypothetical protein